MSNNVMLIRMNGNVEIFKPKSLKLDDIKELGEGFLDTTNVGKTNLTVITNDENNSENWNDEQSKINSAALHLLSAIGVFKGTVVGYKGDIIIAGPFNYDNETISGIPEEWMSKIEAMVK